jgi:hypothetical protein
VELFDVALTSQYIVPLANGRREKGNRFEFRPSFPVPSLLLGSRICVIGAMNDFVHRMSNVHVTRVRNTCA